MAVSENECEGDWRAAVGGVRLARARAADSWRTVIGGLRLARLDAFQVSIDLVELVGQLRLPRGNSNVFDQLKRAATSCSLNLAEGCGKEGRDRRRFFSIACGSALEAAAALSILKALSVIAERDYRRGRSDCQRLYAMLTKLMR